MHADAGPNPVAMMLKATDETDSYGWKKFNSGNAAGSVPSLYVNYDSPPTVPTGLQVLGARPSSDPNVLVVSSRQPTLSSVHSDPDGGLVNANTELYSGTTLLANRVVSAPSGSAVAARLADWGVTLQEGATYSFRAGTDDGVVGSGWSAKTTFRVDTVAPGTPTVTSSSYPNDNTWHGGAGQAGTFTLTPAAGSDTASYSWGLDAAPAPTNTVPGGSSPKPLTVTPASDGKHVLNVAAFDQAGNQSGVLRYVFFTGRAGLQFPDEGDRAVRRTRLAVTSGDSSLTHVQFVFRRGPDGGAGTPIPLGHLTRPDGTALTAGWTPLAELAGSCPTAASGDTATAEFCAATGGFAVWDAGLTLGAAGGPVQVQARLATDATGSSTAPTTQWVTIVLDPSADGAATDEVGPGSVNLLTGDFTLTGQDADEFGLTIGRAASSRSTDSGYQPQNEQLNPAQSSIALSGTGYAGCASTTKDFSSCNITLSRVTDRGHSPSATGLDALQLVGSGGTSTSTFAVVGGGDEGMRLGMHPGGRYRATGWVFMPGVQGAAPAPTTSPGTVLTGFSDGPAGRTATSSNSPTALNTWQQLSVDFTVPADATSAFLHLNTGYPANSTQQVLFDDLSLRELWAPLGPQWDLATQDASDVSYASLSFPEPDLATVKLSGGGQVWFTGAGGGDGGSWFPEPGAEDLKLTRLSTNPVVWRVSETDGTVTDFRQRADRGDWLVDTSSPAVTAHQSRYVYAAAGTITRLARIIAPVEDGVDPAACAADPSTTGIPRGCRVLELVYATGDTAPDTSGLRDVAGQLTTVRAWSYDGTTSPPGPTGSATAVDVARYRYDTAGRLKQVLDPRLPALATSYDYDSAGRVTALAPAGELGWTFGYGSAGPTSTGSGDLVDASSGRLIKVSRASLTPARAGQAGYNTPASPISTSIVYRVPLSRTAGGPYDLTAATIGSWAQVEAPTDATAIFGPDTTISSSTATSTTPGPDGYAAATVHYLNGSGLEVNTASPAAAGTGAVGDIDTTEFDRFGNTVRSLDATNRRLALGQLPDAPAQLAELGLTGASTATRALLLSTLTTYSADGLDQLSETGPARRLAVDNDPTTLTVTRSYTANSYDEGKPDGATYHLLTTSREGTRPVDGTAPTITETTRTGYDPVDPAISPLDARSGWKHGNPTLVTGAAGDPLQVQASVSYDDRGRAIRSVKTGSSGTDAGTTITTLYRASTDNTDGCGNRPEWAGLPCQTTTAGPVSGHDTTRMAGALPVKKVTGYTRLDDPTTVTDSATGPAGGAAVAQTRTTTTSYDTAGRVTTVETTGTGAGLGPAVKTLTGYDPITGDATSSQGYVDGVSTGTIARSYDSLGRLTRYVDAAGGSTDTVFDSYGKPVTITDSAGSTRTLSYDRTAEPRGLLTQVVDSVAGTLTASYGPDGQLLRQTLPGAVTLTLGYDAAGEATSRRYTRDSDNAVLAASSQVLNGNGQVVAHTTDASAKTYRYDSLGRLTSVQDTLTGIGRCNWRAYTYNQRAGRTGKASTTSTGTGSTCTDDPAQPGTPAARTSYSYDSADRLQASTGADTSAAWTYDPLGRITTAPVASNPGATVRNTFHANDRIAGQQIDGVAQQSWQLDALSRLAGYTNQAWTGTGWAQAVTKVNHYDSDSDSPAWTDEDTSLPSEITRYLDGLDGQQAVQTGKTGNRVLQLVDLHGDTMATLPIHDGDATAATGELRYQASDEYGQPTDLTTGTTRAGTGAAPSRDNRYGYLGGAQRSADALAGVLLMGARLYDPATGRFWSPDPSPGGNATAYDYCAADPVNCTDLDGEWGMPKAFKRALKVVARVAEVASWIPGPIGAAAAGISAVAYASTGNYSKALAMGIMVAAAFVGGAAIVKGVQRYGKPALKAGRALNQAAKARYGQRLAGKAGRNRVTIEYATGRWHYDLTGKAHHVRAGQVRTPHKMWQPRNAQAPHGWGRSLRKETTSMNWRDLHRVRRHLSRRR